MYHVESSRMAFEPRLEIERYIYLQPSAEPELSESGFGDFEECCRCLLLTGLAIVGILRSKTI